MQWRYTVTVDIDAAKIESGNPADVVRDEIKSNLESVPWTKRCDVKAVTPGRGR